LVATNKANQRNIKTYTTVKIIGKTKLNWKRFRYSITNFIHIILEAFIAIRDHFNRGFFPANLFYFFHFESFLITFHWLEKGRKLVSIEVNM